MGFDPWNGNPNYASLPLPGTDKKEGLEYTKPFQQLSSRPFILFLALNKMLDQSLTHTRLLLTKGFAGRKSG